MVNGLLLTAVVSIAVLAAACGTGAAPIGTTPAEPSVTSPSTSERPTTLPTIPAPGATTVDETDTAAAQENYEAGVQLQAGQYFEQAIARYDEALRLDSDHTLAYNNRGTAYQEFRRHQRAIDDFDAAIRLEPQLPIAYVVRAQVYTTLGQAEEAQRDLDRAVELGLDLETLLSLMGGSEDQQ